MQPTETQVQRSLEALRETPGSGDDHPGADSASVGRRLVEEVPRAVLERLRDEPAVRPERLAEARQRLAAGDVPSDEALARRMVGRLVCDRLR